MEYPDVEGNEKFLIDRGKWSDSIFPKKETSIKLFNDMIITVGLKDLYIVNRPASTVEGSYVVVDSNVTVGSDDVPEISGDITPETLYTIFLDSFSNVANEALGFEYPLNYIFILESISLDGVKSSDPFVTVKFGYKKVDDQPWP